MQHSWCIKIPLLLLIILVGCHFVIAEESCNVNDNSAEGCSSEAQTLSDDPEENHIDEVPSHKYKKDSNSHWSHLQLIHEAEMSYRRCAKNCSCHYRQIKADLHPFRRGITKNQVEDARSRGVLYQVIDGQVYREEKCMFPSRCTGIEHFLLEFCSSLPNTELIVNVRDWPQTNLRSPSTLIPVFSFSKQEKVQGDILYPAWSFWEGGPAISLHPTGLGRWDLRRKTLINAGNKYKWSKKKDIAFFRGSRTSSDRDGLVLLSREEPALADAAYTKNQAWKSDKDTLGAPPAAEVSLENHCQYKYLFNFHGVAASFRFKHLFLCGSVVFHEEDGWIEFFYPQMKPWIHYIPVPQRPSQQEIKDLLEFALSNDAIVRQIARAGREFILDRLGMADVKCYWRKLVKTYAKLLKYEPTLRDDVSIVAPKKH